MEGDQRGASCRHDRELWLCQPGVRFLGRRERGPDRATVPSRRRGRKLPRSKREAHSSSLNLALSPRSVLQAWNARNVQDYGCHLGRRCHHRFHHSRLHCRSGVTIEHIRSRSRCFNAFFSSPAPLSSPSSSPPSSFPPSFSFLPLAPSDFQHLQTLAQVHLFHADVLLLLLSPRCSGRCLCFPSPPLCLPL